MTRGKTFINTIWYRCNESILMIESILSVVFIKKTWISINTRDFVILDPSAATPVLMTWYSIMNFLYVSGEQAEWLTSRMILRQPIIQPSCLKTRTKRASASDFNLLTGWKTSQLVISNCQFARRIFTIPYFFFLPHHLSFQFRCEWNIRTGCSEVRCTLKFQEKD